MIINPKILNFPPKSAYLQRDEVWVEPAVEAVEPPPARELIHPVLHTAIHLLAPLVPGVPGKPCDEAGWCHQVANTDLN